MRVAALSLAELFLRLYGRGAPRFEVRLRCFLMPVYCWPGRRAAAPTRQFPRPCIQAPGEQSDPGARRKLGLSLAGTTLEKGLIAATSAPGRFVESSAKPT